MASPKGEKVVTNKPSLLTFDLTLRIHYLKPSCFFPCSGFFLFHLVIK